MMYETKGQMQTDWIVILLNQQWMELATRGQWREKGLMGNGINPTVMDVRMKFQTFTQWLEY